jgi:hypothetical protein
LNNTVSDFTIGSDTIQLNGISAFTQLSITQSGADTVIQTLNGLSIATLLNTDSTQLTNSSFGYVN